MIPTISQSLAQCKPCQQISLPLVHHLLPPQLVQDVLTDCHAWEKRERKLNMQALIYVLIAQHLFPHLSTSDVWRQLQEGRSPLGEQPAPVMPTPGALSQRRKQLGVTPMRELFARTVRPIATAATKGATAFNLRLVALDGTLDNVVDTDANRAVFPYNGNDQVHSSSPQVRALVLMECGTHAIFDAEIVPCDEGEYPTAFPLLTRSLQPGMLLLCDRGFGSHDLITLVWRRGAHLLGRLQAHMLPHPHLRLSDGTYLAHVLKEPGQPKKGYHLTVRVIEYTLTDQRLPGCGQRFRLVTTLTDPIAYPAKVLIGLSHERWEVEGALDECKTHLRLSSRTLRSLTPQGVEQELYALFLAHFLLRSLLHLAALAQDLDPDQLSFTHARQVLQRTHWRFALLPEGEHPRLRLHLLQDIGQGRLPARRQRFQRRVLKQPLSKFKHKQYQDFRVPALPVSFLSCVSLLI